MTNLFKKNENSMSTKMFQLIHFFKPPVVARRNRNQLMGKLLRDYTTCKWRQAKADNGESTARCKHQFSLNCIHCNIQNKSLNNNVKFRACSLTQFFFAVVGARTALEEEIRGHFMAHSEPQRREDTSAESRVGTNAPQDMTVTEPANSLYIHPTLQQDRQKLQKKKYGFSWFNQFKSDFTSKCIFLMSSLTYCCKGNDNLLHTQKVLHSS